MRRTIIFVCVHCGRETKGYLKVRSPLFAGIYRQAHTCVICREKERVVLAEGNYRANGEVQPVVAVDGEEFIKQLTRDGIRIIGEPEVRA